MSREILGYVYSSATLILGGDCSQESEPDQLQSKISTAVGQVQIPDCSHPPLCGVKLPCVARVGH